MNEMIGISEVLDKINVTVDPTTTEVRTFSIRFYTSDGAKREILIRKYTRGALQESKGVENRGKASHNLQAAGLVMLQDLTNDRTIEVRATSMYGFKDYKSDRWLKIFH